ncbi:MAG: hypothetical protein OXN17_08350 [Candidatus Poribacteria bacterium]|nr:hypothetical protein [Candidatus Poribacteria bacterium]
MAEPISTTTLLALAGISAGNKILGGIYDRITNRRLYELQDEVLNQQMQFNRDLQRRSRGRFTGAELAMIRQNAEPQLQAASGNIAARLGTSSPAGIALLQQAQQAPINAAMGAATAQYGASLSELSRTLNQRLGQLAGDSSFMDDLGSILKNYMYLKKIGQNPDDETTRGAVDTLTRSAPNLHAAWERLKNSGSGYQPRQAGNS